MLGHIVTAEGIRPDPSLLRRIVEAKTPTNKTEVRQFLGMTGFYRKFIPKYAEIATPLHQSLQDNSTHDMEAIGRATQALKEKMTQPPVLIMADLN